MTEETLRETTKQKADEAFAKFAGNAFLTAEQEVLLHLLLENCFLAGYKIATANAVAKLQESSGR